MCQTFNHKNMSKLYVVDKSGESNGISNDQIILLVLSVSHTITCQHAKSFRTETATVQLTRRISHDRNIWWGQTVYS